MKFLLILSAALIVVISLAKGRHEMVRHVANCDSLFVTDSVTLRQNIPNPCDSLTTIFWTLPDHKHIRISLFDNLGRLVAALLDTTLERGGYQATLATCALAPGLYYYRLEYTMERISKRMVVVGCR